jgi:hypothetical protein
VLASHQTIKECNFLLRMSSLLNDPVWIRTCYTIDIQDAYEKIFEDGLQEYVGSHGEIMLDDEDLYGGYGEAWMKIFLCLPLLPDAVLHHGGDPAYTLHTDPAQAKVCHHHTHLWKVRNDVESQLPTFMLIIIQKE